MEVVLIPADLGVRGAEDAYSLLRRSIQRPEEKLPELLGRLQVQCVQIGLRNYSLAVGTHRCHAIFRPAAKLCAEGGLHFSCFMDQRIKPHSVDRHASELHIRKKLAKRSPVERVEVKHGASPPNKIASAGSSLRALQFPALQLQPGRQVRMQEVNCRGTRRGVLNPLTAEPCVQLERRGRSLLAFLRAGSFPQPVFAQEVRGQPIQRIAVLLGVIAKLCQGWIPKASHMHGVTGKTVMGCLKTLAET
mmetsp:Transcript_43390/g.70285  ORF Transcript_43390/g.70285 Transcript_43390/m.70285 type:complete len:248 (-) Transcript_43390:540-1283(-)